MTPESTLFRRENLSLLAAAPESVGYDFGENFVSMCHEGDAPVVATLDSIFVLVCHFDSGVVLLLRHPPGAQIATMML